MANALSPSGALPEFLQAELGVGETSAHGLVRALDTFVRALSSELGVRALSLNAPTLESADKKLWLERAGFRVEELSELELAEFFAKRTSFFHERGLLRAVERLAQLYFPACTVRLGRPFAQSRLQGRGGLYLADLGDRRTTVFVRAMSGFSDKRSREFVHNARVLLPEPYRVLLEAPKPAPQAPEKHCLGAPRRWEGRRLECRISVR